MSKSIICFICNQPIFNPSQMTSKTYIFHCPHGCSARYYSLEKENCFVENWVYCAMVDFIVDSNFICLIVHHPQIEREDKIIFYDHLFLKCFVDPPGGISNEPIFSLENDRAVDFLAQENHVIKNQISKLINFL